MKHRIVVLGAGYAGANAAGRLARRLSRADVEIVVVNAAADFVERVRLHQVATGQRLRDRPLAGAFAGTGAEVRLATVTAVDPERRVVVLSDGELGYDTLVYALGSTGANVPELAFTMAGRESALRLRDRLGSLASGTRVLVVGGGLTGIEAATEIAESRPDLDVAISDRGEVGGWLSARARRHLRKVFTRLGVGTHDHTDVTEVLADEAVTAEGERIPAGLTVWAAGFAVHPIAAASGLEVDPNGRIVVDASMRSVSHPDVYAVGDAALAAGVNDRPLRMSCASGMPMAWQAADALAARLTGQQVRTKPVPYVLQCVSLGRRDGLVQFVTPDDRPKNTVITGWVAARIKEFICAGAAWSVSHSTTALPTRRRRTSPGAAMTSRAAS